jgi:hypothetical protein
MKTQAWGWLAAAVLAAGLNSSYRNGGMQWAHEIADRVQHNTGAVLTLATSRANQFLAEARMMKLDRSIDSQDPQCPFSSAIAQVKTSFDQSQPEFGRFQAMPEREQGQLARLEANRARMEARIQSRLARVHFAEGNFRPVVVQLPKIDCPRLHVNIPRVPRIKVPAPVVHVEYSGPGPV